MPREAYSKLRYQYLKGLANRDSWERAIALHAEMNQKGLELPASELLEFIEVSPLIFLIFWIKITRTHILNSTHESFSACQLALEFIEVSFLQLLGFKG